METIPLFPLETVLCPGGRVQLKIIEPRYIDLISASLKHDAGFGMVSPLKGAEIIDAQGAQRPSFNTVATYVKIVDWDSLPNNRLAITVQGINKFRLSSSYQQADHLYRAEVEWIAPERRQAVPAVFKELQSLLSQLGQHPQVQQLNYDLNISDAAGLGFLLAQLLPIDNNVRYQLLSLKDPLDRLQAIDDLLEELSR